mmetsp:Transcript_13039/g.23656  ORF Transcript_13039/g.23656 Transcript_13039/m.23656 type:complete len:84 (+) Transcript_13039:124-375(+)
MIVPRVRCPVGDVTGARMTMRATPRVACMVVPWEWIAIRQTAACARSQTLSTNLSLLVLDPFPFSSFFSSLVPACVAALYALP